MARTCVLPALLLAQNVKPLNRIVRLALEILTWSMEHAAILLALLALVLQTLNARHVMMGSTYQAVESA